MPLDLSAILDQPILPGTKGLPPAATGRPLSAIALHRWDVSGGEVPLPAATLRRDALDANMAEMNRYLSARGAVLAPHGKTTMCPQLFERQIDAGAWAITVATVAQAQVCHAVGVPRVIIANEIIGDAELAMFAAMCADVPDRDYYCLVDSLDGARGLQNAFAAVPGCPPANILIEFGMSGGRCGLRTPMAVVELARAVRHYDRIALRGVEGYEGLIVSADAARDAAKVAGYLDDLVDAFARCRDAALFDVSDHAQPPMISAGGSVYYDLVAALTRKSLDGAALLVVRSGCYVTHDSGFYRRALANVADRDPSHHAPALVPALHVWARVLSVPEPGLAILSAGKRDLSFDIDLPVPELVRRPGGSPGAAAAPVPISGWSIVQLSDQHAFARSDATDATALHVGDIIALGISHPCTTFDKWPVLLEVDDDYRVVGGLRTFF